MAKARFLTIAQFKEELGLSPESTIEVLDNPKTGKVFMSAGGNSFRVEQAIDNSKEMKVLIPEDETIENACLINVSAGATTKFTL